VKLLEFPISEINQISITTGTLQTIAFEVNKYSDEERKDIAKKVGLDIIGDKTVFRQNVRISIKIERPFCFLLPTLAKATLKMKFYY